MEVEECSYKLEFQEKRKIREKNIYNISEDRNKF